MHHWTLLQYGYSMTDENLKNFKIVSKINSNQIGWTLGYMINQTNSIDPEIRPERLLTQSEFGGLVFLCSFVLLISLVIGGVSVFFYKQRRHY